MDEKASVIRILMADDHPVFRLGLRTLLEAEPQFQVVGEAVDGSEVAPLAKRLKPNVLLLDLAMPRLTGMDVLRELARSTIHMHTIVLTVAIEKPQIVEALQLGARGILLKEVATQLVIKCIRKVMDGQYWVGRQEVTDLIAYLRGSMPAAKGKEPLEALGLTPRELEIISAIVAGYTNKDIAEKLSLSQETVKHHLSHIFDKAGVSNRLELALWSIRHGFV